MGPSEDFKVVFPFLEKHQVSIWFPLLRALASLAKKATVARSILGGQAQSGKT